MAFLSEDDLLFHRCKKFLSLMLCGLIGSGPIAQIHSSSSIGDSWDPRLSVTNENSGKLAGASETGVSSETIAMVEAISENRRDLDSNSTIDEFHFESGPIAGSMLRQATPSVRLDTRHQTFPTSGTASLKIDVYSADPSKIDEVSEIADRLGMVIDAEVGRNPELRPELFVLGYNPMPQGRLPQSVKQQDSRSSPTAEEQKAAQRSRVTFTIVRAVASGVAVYFATYVAFGPQFSTFYATAAASIGGVASGVLQYLAGYPWYKRFFAPGKNVIPRTQFDIAQLAKNLGLYAAYFSLVRSPFLVQSLNSLEHSSSVLPTILAWQVGVWQASGGAAWAALPWANALIEKFQRDLKAAGDDQLLQILVNRKFNRNFLFLALFLLGTGVASVKVPGIIWYIQIPFGILGIGAWKWVKITEYLKRKGFENPNTREFDLFNRWRRNRMGSLDSMSHEDLLESRESEKTPGNPCSQVPNKKAS